MWHDWWVTSDVDVVGDGVVTTLSSTDEVELGDLSASHAELMDPQILLEELTVTVDVSRLGPAETGVQVMITATIEALARRDDVTAVRLVGKDKLPAYARHLPNLAKVHHFTSKEEVPRSDTMWYPHQVYANLDDFGEARSLGRRIVVTNHDFIPYDIPNYHETLSDHIIYRGFQRRIALAVDGVTTVSHDVARRVIEDVPRIDSNRICVTVNGVDHLARMEKEDGIVSGGLTALKIFLNRYGSLNDYRPFILVLGTNYVHKNRDFAMKVWQEVLNNDVECDIVMAGETLVRDAKFPVSNEYELAAGHTDSRGDVYMVGWNVDEACRLWLYSNAAVVLYPSSAEGFGLPPYEAAALGTPASFTDFGPLREVSRVAGLPAHWSVEEYVEDITVLLTDPGAAQRRVDALREAASRHTWDGFAQVLVSFFGRVAQMPVSPAGALGGHSEVVTQAVAALLGSAVPGQVGTDDIFSVVVPVCDAPMDRVWQCLDSVVSQTSRSWELVVVVGSLLDERQSAFMAAFAAQYAEDSRVVVVRQTGEGMTDALNVGLSAASGEYVGFVDPEDVLDPRCIEEFGAAVVNLPDAVYCDEDKFSEWGSFEDPYFKPDFSPELLLTQMYLCHFAVFRRNLVLEVGGFRQGCEWAQDYDLVLRLLPRLDQVAHIPKVLYHWRSDNTVVNLGLDVERSAQEADARVQRDYLERTFGGGEVVASSTPGINLVHPQINEATRVSVIIPTIGKDDGAGGRMVDTAVRSLIESETRLKLEFVIVTTGVIADVQIDDLRGHEIRHVVYETPAFNFSEAINLGASESTGEYLLLLNDDTEVVSPDPVSRLLEIAQIPEVAVTGCLLTYPDGRIQHAGMVITGPLGPFHCWNSLSLDYSGYFGSTLSPRNFSAVTAAAVMIRTAIFHELGGFDVAFPIDFNDVDFCLRSIDSGYRVAWTPYARWIHFVNATLDSARNSVGREFFEERWQASCDVDPFYLPALHSHPNLLYKARS
jgi:GT2 family glycosyltransferase/glycosyltransferase involved in cell wall biosynthesis